MCPSNLRPPLCCRTQRKGEAGRDKLKLGEQMQKVRLEPLEFKLVLQQSPTRRAAVRTSVPEQTDTRPGLEQTASPHSLKYLELRNVLLSSGETEQREAESVGEEREDWETSTGDGWTTDDLDIEVLGLKSEK